MKRAECAECGERPCDGRRDHTVWKFKDLRETRCCDKCCPGIKTWSEEKAAILEYIEKRCHEKYSVELAKVLRGIREDRHWSDVDA